MIIGDRVVIPEFDIILRGIVVDKRDTTLAEFNSEHTDNPDKPAPTQLSSDANIFRLVEVCLVLVDGEDTPREFYKIIHKEDYYDTILQP
jgi:hypothetical protein